VFEFGDFRRVRTQDTRFIQRVAHFFQLSSLEACGGALDTARKSATPHARFECSPSGTAGVSLIHAENHMQIRR
jgi:hypothetical protein